jgi:hypothetical protein
MMGGLGNDLIAGGAGNDVISVDSGHDVVLYNAGDGRDHLYYEFATTDLTLSVGGGFHLNALTFTKHRGDLVLEVGSGASGAGDSDHDGADNAIVFANKELFTDEEAPQVTLQLITEASADFDAESSNPLLNGQVQQFDFNQLVEAFEASGQDRWALTDVLLDAHLESDAEGAIGGSLAHNYGLSGNAGTTISANELVQLLSNPNLGQKPQAVAFN